MRFKKRSLESPHWGGGQALAGTGASWQGWEEPEEPPHEGEAPKLALQHLRTSGRPALPTLHLLEGLFSNPSPHDLNTNECRLGRVSPQPPEPCKGRVLPARVQPSPSHRTAEGNLLLWQQRKQDVAERGRIRQPGKAGWCASQPALTSSVPWGSSSLAPSFHLGLLNATFGEKSVPTTVPS